MIRAVWASLQYGPRASRKHHGLVGVVIVMLAWVSIFAGCATQVQDVPTLLERYRQKLA
jgi:hypothetical protein